MSLAHNQTRKVNRVEQCFSPLWDTGFVALDEAVYVSEHRVVAYTRP